MISKTKQNILVTGANGFVGKALVKELIKSSDNIFLVSRDKDYKLDGVGTFYGDLLDKDFCKKIVTDIDTVFYLAGYKKNISHHTKYPNDFVFGNVEPLMSFLKAVKGSTIKKIIYLSSTNVGLYKDGEEDGYVVGKYINELILKSFSKQRDIDIKIVRSVPIYGPGDNFNPETANFIPAMINKVYESKKEVLVWGSGRRELQFVFIDDLVSNMIEISKLSEKFFVVGNPKTLTINEIVEKIVWLSGKDLKIKNDITKPDRPTQLFKFNNAVIPEVGFDKGLEKTINYYKTTKKI